MQPFTEALASSDTPLKSRVNLERRPVERLAELGFRMQQRELRLAKRGAGALAVGSPAYILSINAEWNRRWLPTTRR